MKRWKRKGIIISIIVVIVFSLFMYFKFSIKKGDSQIIGYNRRKTSQDIGSGHS